MSETDLDLEKGNPPAMRSYRPHKNIREASSRLQQVRSAPYRGINCCMQPP